MNVGPALARLNAASAYSEKRMTKSEHLPRGGIDPRKYAAFSLALGMVRGALSEALAGNLDDAKRILDGTSTSEIAKALGCSESGLAIDWNDHLTTSELDRIRGF